jgi:hypothetical protein
VKALGPQGRVMEGDRPAVSAAVMRKGVRMSVPHVPCRVLPIVQQAARAVRSGYSAGGSTGSGTLGGSPGRMAPTNVAGDEKSFSTKTVAVSPS